MLVISPSDLAATGQGNDAISFFYQHQGDCLFFKQQDARKVDSFLRCYVVGGINERWKNMGVCGVPSTFLDGQGSNAVMKALIETRGSGGSLLHGHEELFFQQRVCGHPKESGRPFP